MLAPQPTPPQQPPILIQGNELPGKKKRKTTNDQRLYAYLKNFFNKTRLSYVRRYYDAGYTILIEFSNVNEWQIAKAALLAMNRMANKTIACHHFFGPEFFKSMLNVDNKERNTMSSGGFAIRFHDFSCLVAFLDYLTRHEIEFYMKGYMRYDNNKSNWQLVNDSVDLFSDGSPAWRQVFLSKERLLYTGLSQGTLFPSIEVLIPVLLTLGYKSEDYK